MQFCYFNNLQSYIVFSESKPIESDPGNAGVEN